MSQDTKRLIIGMVLALAAMIGYQYLISVLYPTPQKPAPLVEQTQPSSTQTMPSSTPSVPSTAATTRTAGTQPAVPTENKTPASSPAPLGLAVRPVSEVASSVLGSKKPDDPNFRLELATTATGAAIEQVTLNPYKMSAEKNSPPFVFLEPYSYDKFVRPETRSMATLWVKIGDAPAAGDETQRKAADEKRTIWLNANVWSLDKTRTDANSVTYVAQLVRQNEVFAKIYKTYRLSPKSDDPKSDQGFGVQLTYRIENLGAASEKFQLAFNGPTAPPRELEGQGDQAMVAGYWADGVVKVKAEIVESSFEKDTPKDLTKNDKGHKAIWAGTQSAYFDALVRPIPEEKKPTADWLNKVDARLLNHWGLPEHKCAQMQFETTALEVAGKSAQNPGVREVAVEMYLGPRARQVLKSEHFSVNFRQYNLTLASDQSTGQTCFIPFCAWCCDLMRWPFLIDVLVWLLSIFFALTRDWGVAIIVLVVLVRALLHPITKKSQVHMVKMQKMQPKIEEIKKKFADNKEALAKAQMELYKEHGMNPILGCLPMLLQMPIWIALWSSLQGTFELRHAPLFYNLTWVHDLAKPDYLVKFAEPVELIFGWRMRGINILPILMGVVFYLQTKYQPKPPTMTPEQESQQTMMTWMSTLLFPFMLYTGPSGLNLYILTSTFFGIVESKVIRKHIKEREELEAKQGPKIIDAPAAKEKESEAPKKKGWLERLTDKAEEYKKQQGKGKKKKK